MRKFIKLQKGQTLVEITLAMGVASIVIVGLSILAISSLKNAQDAVRRSESQKFANAGVEAVLFFKNSQGFNDAIFPAVGVTDFYCMNNSAELLPIADTNCALDSTLDPNGDKVVSPTTGLAYYRVLSIERLDDDNMRVVSTILWEDTQGVKTVSVPRDITNWRRN